MDDYVTPIKSFNKVMSYNDSSGKSQQEYGRLASMSHITNETKLEKYTGSIEKSDFELRVFTTEKEPIFEEKNMEDITLRESNIIAEFQSVAMISSEESSLRTSRENRVNRVATKLREFSQKPGVTLTPPINLDYMTDRNGEETLGLSPTFFDGMETPTMLKQSVIRTMTFDENSSLAKNGVASLLPDNIDDKKAMRTESPGNKREKKSSEKSASIARKKYTENHDNNDHVFE